jgi:hypothetical protein
MVGYDDIIFIKYRLARLTRPIPRVCIEFFQKSALLGVRSYYKEHLFEWINTHPLFPVRAAKEMAGFNHRDYWISISHCFNAGLNKRWMLLFVFIRTASVFYDFAIGSG